MSDRKNGGRNCKNRNFSSSLTATPPTAAAVDDNAAVSGQSFDTVRAGMLARLSQLVDQGVFASRIRDLDGLVRHRPDFDVGRFDQLLSVQHRRLLLLRPGNANNSANTNTDENKNNNSINSVDPMALLSDPNSNHGYQGLGSAMSSATTAAAAATVAGVTSRKRTHDATLSTPVAVDSTCRDETAAERVKRLIDAVRPFLEHLSRDASEISTSLTLRQPTIGHGHNTGLQILLAAAQMAVKAKVFAESQLAAIADYLTERANLVTSARAHPEIVDY